MLLFNTMSRKKETFKPLHEGKVGIYVCGPTVYDVGHLGHARSAVSFDVIRRYFEYKGFEVNFVSNVTDVDDKMIKRAAEEGITEKALAERIIPEYAKDYGALKVKAPTHQPRATEYIPKMVELIERLIQKGAAYVTDDGVYFEVGKFPGYGKLSGQNLDELQAGARIAVDEKKKHPEDFALWKREKPGEPSWVGPQGIQGRPGWHIECSAMSMDILGETFDIHGGGIDLQFPHHEDEIAQSEMATENPFARFWLHNGHIRIDKEKMSKSLGNFFTIKSILAKYNPLVVRYFLLSTHYRMPIDFTHELLEQAKNSLQRLQDFWRAVTRLAPGSKPVWGKESQPLFELAKTKFEAAMDDDFEISTALAPLFDFVRDINSLMQEGKLSSDEAAAVVGFLASVDEILQVMKTDDFVAADIEKLIQERQAARAEKNYQRSDEVRDLLLKQGIVLEDTPQGTVWKRVL